MRSVREAGWRGERVLNDWLAEQGEGEAESVIDRATSRTACFLA
jgi:hypothetical protein